MSTRFEQLEEKRINQQKFDSYKNAGYLLLQNQEIDNKTYYKKVREKGIELGLIDQNDYPDRLPGFAEDFLTIAGGVVGAVGGGIAGVPLGPAGIIAGAAAGAGLGSATASLGADYLGDLIAPDMPKPTTEERIKDAAFTGLIDATLTAAIPVAGKTLQPAAKKAIKSIKESVKKSAKGLPNEKQRVNLIEKALGIDDAAQEKATILAKEGVPLSLGQASSSPFVTGVYNLGSRMPIAGAPAQKQIAKSFEKINEALDKKISLAAKVKPLTETERSTLIKEFGIKSFNDWRSQYKSLYRKSEDLMKKEGDFFDISPIIQVVNRSMSQKGRFNVLPAELQTLFRDIVAVGLDFQTTKKGLVRTPNKLNLKDIQSLDTRINTLARKYDPAKKLDTADEFAYKSVISLNESLRKQLRNPQTEYGRLLLEADRRFKSYMAVVEGKTGKEFSKVLTKGALRPGIGRAPSARLEDLYKKTFGEVKSPQAVDELRELVGTKRLNILAANHIDDLFTRYLKSDKKDFDKLYKSFGFDNVKSKQYEATKNLLRDYKETNVDDLFNFLDALKQFPEALPDVNTFILRSGILRSAQGVTPAALVGMTGVSIGGGLGAVASFGLIRVLNSFLSRPFNKKLIKNLNKKSKEEKRELIKRFLESLPKLPDIPVSSIAVQPAVPIIEQEISEQ